MKYNVGDKVRIKNIDWYNENKDEYGDVSCGEYDFVSNMSVFCGKILTIDVDFEDETYLMKEDTDGFVFTSEMIESLVERNGKTYPYKIGDRIVLKNHRYATITDLKYNSFGNLSYYIKIDNDKDVSVDIYDNMIEGLVEEEPKPIDFTIKATDTKGKVEVVIPDGYSYVIENDKLYFITEKKDVTYPKTYEECCRVLGVSEFEYNHTGTKMWYRHKLMATLDNLMLCRDAYWKIAGEEMGLDGPWEPDWNIRGYYGIARSYGNVIKTSNYNCDLTFVFPTEEMRDVFYENFNELIEFCKEFL